MWVVLAIGQVSCPSPANQEGGPWGSAGSKRVKFLLFFFFFTHPLPIATPISKAAPELPATFPAWCPALGRAARQCPRPLALSGLGFP